MSSMSQKPSEERRTFAQALLDKKTWWVHFAIVSGISIVGLVALGTWTYTVGTADSRLRVATTGEDGDSGQIKSPAARKCFTSGA